MSRDNGWGRARVRHLRELESKGHRPGYYLQYKGCNHWFATSLQEARCKVDAITARVMADDCDQYSILFSLGIDVHGRAAWTNLDHTDAVVL